MATPEQLELLLKKVHDEESFIQNLLIEGLGWAIDEDVADFESITYDWTEEDLSAEGLNRRLVDGRIRQIQPLAMSQPWGIFLLEFKHPDVFSKGRGMVGVLRKVLRGLIPKKRRAAHLAAWKSEDLLFICTHKWEHYSFVHFAVPRDGAKLARLTSFGWGPESHGRTVLKFNLPALEWPDRTDDPDAWHKAWLAAFDKEALTKNFFRTFQGLYQAVRDDIASDRKQSTEADQKALILLNRLLFLYFIQKKGWLAGKYDFLFGEFDKWHRVKPAAHTFYQSFLFPLFQRLSIPQCNDERFKNVPFLNGGLFEAINTHVDGDLKIKNSIFAVLFDDLLEHYNFTVTEDTPLDIEVAIDPEMLGKIFEELVTGRHETGAYYTPRPIVSFMCREALKGYLGNGKAVEKFVDEHDASGLSNPEAVLDKLKAIRVCDPACGSGAYLVGMMQELMALRHELFQSKKVGSKDAYKRKLGIIQNNLYGVDIDPVAIHIARLRLWLSLVIEYDGPDPDPLPNLDFKIERGDSILCPNPEGGMRQISGLDHLIEQFQELKQQYLVETHDKEHKRTLVDKKREEIISWLAVESYGRSFDYRVDFSEVMMHAKRPGFDVVLANPPYVRHELITEIKPALRATFPDTYNGTADLYCYFYLRALQLLRNGGMLVFISSNKWFRAKYGQKLRDHISQSCDVYSITDFKDLPVFESAIAYAMIFIAQKSKVGTKTTYTEPPSLESPYPDVKAVIQKYGFVVSPDALGGSIWSFSKTNEELVSNKIKHIGIILKKHINSRVYRGITTGLNEAFVIDGETRKALLKADKRSAEIIKPLALGRDISRWSLNFSDRWIIFTRKGIDIDSYPAVKKYLSQWKEELTPRNGQRTVGRKPGSYKWYEIQDDIAYFQVFDKPKIVSTKVSIRPTFAYDSNSHYLGNTSYFFPVGSDGLYILGVLNSKVFHAYAKEVFVEKQNGWFEIQPAGLEAFPIPQASSVEKNAIINLVQKCLHLNGNDCEEVEQEINERVAALYGL